MNWHSVTYYSRNMLLAERKYKTQNAELLALIEAFKTWRYYLKRAVNTIFVLTNHNNPKKFMETTCLSGKQIQLTQELSPSDFKIDYCPGTKNLADALSWNVIDKHVEKRFVEQNRKNRTSCNALYHITITLCSTPIVKQLHNQQCVMRKTALEGIVSKC